MRATRSGGFRQIPVHEQAAPRNATRPETAERIEAPLPAAAARKGPTACTGMSVPMDKLDDLVANHLEDRLLQPDRLEVILSAVRDRRQEQTTRKRAHVADLNKRATETDLRLKLLFDAIENGIADVSDPVLKDRIATLKATRDQAKADAERVTASLGAAGQESVAPDMLTKFAATARQRIRIEGGGYHREHLRALAQRVEVYVGEVRILGSKSNLLQALIAGATETKPGAVPSFVPKWCTRLDSNQWPPD